ncbi:glycoside hydrolase family 10 protein [Serendipita vermifera MAFF 305830]|uniref:Beta-xylanase n=1 Tax=Serendipita vermifera MAFF 305830 TaxID=933852 RepID=A0A0C3BHA6_SERVB|nr:glycoside hydrolase family 10 protein [Serendipita vermifera MAFF 305830]
MKIALSATALCVIPAVVALSISPSSDLPPSTTTSSGDADPTLDSLSARFIAKGKKYWGTATDIGLLLNNTVNEAIVRSQSFLIIHKLTPENSMKWDIIEKTRYAFNFIDSDYLVDYARSTGKLVRGHTFIWHSQLPSWVSAIKDAATLTEVIENHISSVGTRYSGRVYSWDVCNELFTAEGTMRYSVFYSVLGETFVSLAFNAVRKYDQTAKLYINDYNMVSNATQRFLSMINHVKTWISSGVPIDGIGTQAHLSAGVAGDVQAALSALAGSGVSEVAITELDIVQASPSDYVTVTKACLAVSACVGITNWGVSDKESWRTQDKPLLFDNYYRPKPAYEAIIAALT